MTTRMARFLISLYPRRWRVRYEREFLHFLQEQPRSIYTVVNVICSALYQRFLAVAGERFFGLFFHRHGIYSRYTKGARYALFFAHYQASQFGSNSIEPEHFATRCSP
jgi:hypothetical protein